MNKMRFLVPVLILSLAACTPLGQTRADSFFASEDTSGAASDGFPAPSRDSVYEAAMRVVRKQGYIPDPSTSSRQSATVASRWKLDLSPFAGTGYRSKVTVKVQPVRGRSGYFKLSTNVIKQANDNMTEPSNPIAAKWVEGKRDPMMEHLINRQVEMYFLPSDVSPEFRQRYGLPSAESPRIRRPEPKPKEEGPIPGLPFP